MKNQKSCQESVKKKGVLSVIFGAISGFINGIFGGGGGMIVVLVLEKLLKLSPKNSHATAVFIILPLSIISGIFYLTFGSFEVKSGLIIMGGVILGGVAGALVLKKLSNKWLIIIFSLLMAVAGFKLIFF
ncbi:MAG: sulfite exporter TauE/SafE family protein [Clostridia bacterium]|nr:sulfite exporter TauE/SafE family protein [Clostridia bacterium]